MKFFKFVTLNLFQGLSNGKILKPVQNDKGFSLAELLITLIIVSCILAAFAPVITKRMANGGVSIGGGGGTIEKTIVESNVTVDGLTDDCENTDCLLCIANACLICDISCPEGLSRDYKNCRCVDCSPFDANCAQCSQTSCKRCKNGYRMENGICKSCSSLPAGQYCDGKEIKTCPEGYTCEDGAAVKCAINQYSTGGTSKCINCDTGYYSEAGATSCTSCKTFHSKCTACEPDGCKTCEAGYVISGTKCVEDNSDILYYKGLWIYKYNAGDKGGPTIPSTVTVVNTGTSCSPSSKKCCYQKNTGGSTCTNAQGTSTYSGCTRTVCDWNAANEICNSIADSDGITGRWRLPNTKELAMFNTLSYNKGKSGVQLCDETAGYGSVACPYTTNCTGATSSYCFPGRYWASDVSGANAYYYELASGSFTSGSYPKNYYPLSVRCVKNDTEFPENCLYATTDGECSTCESGYTMKGGKCVYDLESDLSVMRYNGLMITKYNAGDPNGPSIPDNVTIVNTGSYCSPSSNKCCWQAARYNTANTSCTSGSGTSTYSGCTRTVCDWNAASEICKHIKDENGLEGYWRLPSYDELASFNLVNYNMGADGLQLCDESTGYGAAACNYTQGTSYCYGATSNYCFPGRYWSGDISGTSAYYFGLESNNYYSSTYNMASYPLSVRCVRQDPNFPEGCLIANSANKCTKCKPGYKLQNGTCTYYLETDEASLIYKGLYITKFNAGDEYGPPIPTTVSSVATNTSCSPSSRKCCWLASRSYTAASGCTGSYGTSKYSGCTRTVCDWNAANEICNSIPGGGWRLPSARELSEFYIMSYGYGKDGLQLCDESAGYGAVVCPYAQGTSYCQGATSHYCFPGRIWSGDITGANAYYYELASGIYYTGSYNRTSYPLSVRCVKEFSNFPEGCLIANSSGKCTTCKTGYKLSNGACDLNISTMKFNGIEMTKYNAGDEYGPPIPESVIVVDTGTGISCSPSSNKCCWRAGKNNTGSSTCTGTSGTSTYSGCTRTVCDWNAAYEICAKIKDPDGTIGRWRLPYNSEWNYIVNNRTTLNTNQGASGLQLCAEAVGYGAAACPYTTNCTGATSSYCFPARYWSGDISGANAYYYELDNSNFSSGNYPKNYYPLSVRCVREAS